MDPFKIYDHFPDIPPAHWLQAAQLAARGRSAGFISGFLQIDLNTVQLLATCDPFLLLVDEFRRINAMPLDERRAHWQAMREDAVLRAVMLDRPGALTKLDRLIDPPDDRRARAGAGAKAPARPTLDDRQPARETTEKDENPVAADGPRLPGQDGPSAQVQASPEPRREAFKAARRRLPDMPLVAPRPASPSHNHPFAAAPQPPQGHRPPATSPTAMATAGEAESPRAAAPPPPGCWQPEDMPGHPKRGPPRG